MKPFLALLALLVAVSSSAPAQQIDLQTIRDSVIGWIKVYKFTGVQAPVTVDDRRYSPTQLSITDSLANWIQASYTPKGALGDVIRAVSPKLGLYNKNDAALPQEYGAYAKTYTELKRDASGKLVPFTNSHLIWSIRANAVLGEPLLMLNTPTQYYFLLPNIGSTAMPVKPDAARYDVSQHPAIKRYFTYFNDALNSTTINATFVVLSKDNKLPFVVITKAEYLGKFADAIERKYAADKAAAISGWPEGKARANALQNADELYQRRKVVLESNRQRYASRLQEPAKVSALQPGVFIESDKDVFEGNGGSPNRYAVYKIDPAMAELPKSDKPQWITVWWDGDLLDPVGKQHVDAIVNNFDFQYVHDFFFDAEKVKGRSYKPLHSPIATVDAPVANPASASAKSNATDASVHFFEDFSTTPVGRTPNAWKIGRTTGTVVNLDGVPGSWVVMAGEASLAPNQLKALPRDFTLTYELVASQNFTWGAKGFSLLLANERSPGNADSFIRLKLRPGFDGKAGEAELETKFAAGYQSGTKWYAATGFSNNAKNNHITVSIKKNGEGMQVFIGANKIADYDRAMPAAQVFNSLRFFVAGSPTELNDKFYVSGVKVSRQ